MSEIDFKKLQSTAVEIRKNIVKMINAAGSGHPGSSLSTVEILTTIYMTQLKHDPKNPLSEDRDRFVLSKGHAAPALYAILAETGYFSKDELMSLRKMGSILQGHPVIQTKKGKAPGVEFTTGPLGQGFSAACGMAKSFKIDNKPNRVYTVLGDGETQEGQVWEAAMFAAHNQLDNLIAFIDNNCLQIDGTNDEVMCLAPFKEKWEAFGFFVQEVDGHNFEELVAAIEKAKEMQGRPSMIICHTVKGKGVSFMENKVQWHGVAPNEEELKTALSDLGGSE